MAHSKPFFYNKNIHCKVEPGTQPLCLVGFSNGNLQSKLSSTIHFETFTSSETNDSNKYKRLMTATSPRLQYSGNNYENSSFVVSSSLLKIAVINKKNSSCKVYDADYFHLKPLFNCQMNALESEKSEKVKRDDLTLTFGSKSRKRAVNSKLKYESTEGAIDDNVLKNTIKNEVQDQDTIEKGVSDESIFPKQNGNATKVSEVYEMYDIVPEHEYSMLDQEAEMFLKATKDDIQSWKLSEKFDEFVLFYLESKMSTITLEQSKLLCYLYYMFCFLKTSYKDWKKKDPVPSVPQPFKKALMSCYTINNSLPQRMKDKILANSLVLTLILCKYNVNGNLWSKSAKVPLKKLIMIAYGLGCHVHNKEKVMHIELKLPLYKYDPVKFKGKK